VETNADKIAAFHEKEWVDVGATQKEKEILKDMLQLIKLNIYAAVQNPTFCQSEDWVQCVKSIIGRLHIEKYVKTYKLNALEQAVAHDALHLKEQPKYLQDMHISSNNVHKTHFITNQQLQKTGGGGGGKGNANTDNKNTNNNNNNNTNTKNNNGGGGGGGKRGGRGKGGGGGKPGQKKDAPTASN
jgi:hypothetical protein